MDTIESLEVGRVLWTNPDTGLWVATINGDYAGMIEFTDGRFVVRDATGVVVGYATSIPAAKQTLISPAQTRFTRTGPLAMIGRAPRSGYRRSTSNVA